MRPQHIAAENVTELAEYVWDEAASMRPQHIAAENDGAALPLPLTRNRFNEAAAYSCGKRPSASGVCCPKKASMRPQHIAAENR